MSLNNKLPLFRHFFLNFLKLLLVLELTVQGNNKKLTGGEKKEIIKVFICVTICFTYSAYFYR